MHFFKGDFRITTKTIGGIQYVVFSFYSDKEHLFDRVENIISNSVDLGNMMESADNSLVGSDIPNKNM